MSILRVIARLHADTALPEDDSVNVWHFTGDGDFVLAANAGLVLDKVQTFYASIDSMLGTTLSGAYSLQAYDLGDPEPRVPIAIDAGTFTPAATALPSEVALVSSFQAPLQSGQNQASRRGRVYIGPLSSASAEVALGEVRPTAAVRTQLANATDALATGNVGTQNHGLAVYSRVNGTAVRVTNGWVDNAFDTQRRRGKKHTLRLTWAT